jgi:hypothetical protein
MSPKEKAEDLIDKYIQFLPYYSKTNNLKRAVGSALIAVDEILSMGIMAESRDWNMAKEFWEEVKQEIEKVEL